METNFKDYTPQQLVGKLVLHTCGMSYNKEYSKAIRKISKVTKTAFKIEGDEKLFSITDGRQKGLNDRMDVGFHSACSLITEDEAKQLRAEWTQKKIMKGWKEEITSKLPDLSFEQLHQIINIIGKK